LGKIVALGEVVSDIYRGESLSDVELGFVARPGGAPANVAVAASRLGSAAAFVGSVGEDLFGDFILGALESEGVETGGVSRQSAPTRTSLAFVEIGPNGDRSFTFYRSSPAADELLSAEDVTEGLISGTSFVNFGSIPLIREPARSATHRIAELAREHDVPVAFDVNFREHLWEGREAAREAVDPLLDLSTIVKLGDDELEPLLGTDDVDEAAQGRSSTAASRWCSSARGQTGPSTPPASSGARCRPSISRRSSTPRAPGTPSSPPPSCTSPTGLSPKNRCARRRSGAARPGRSPARPTAP